MKLKSIKNKLFPLLMSGSLLLSPIAMSFVANRNSDGIAVENFKNVNKVDDNFDNEAINLLRRDNNENNLTNENDVQDFVNKKMQEFYEKGINFINQIKFDLKHTINMISIFLSPVGLPAHLAGSEKKIKFEVNRSFAPTIKPTINENDDVHFVWDGTYKTPLTELDTKMKQINWEISWDPRTGVGTTDPTNMIPFNIGSFNTPFGPTITSDKYDNVSNFSYLLSPVEVLESNTNVFEPKIVMADFIDKSSGGDATLNGYAMNVWSTPVINATKAAAAVAAALPFFSSGIGIPAGIAIIAGAFALGGGFITFTGGNTWFDHLTKDYVTLDFTVDPLTNKFNSQKFYRTKYDNIFNNINAFIDILSDKDRNKLKDKIWNGENKNEMPSLFKWNENMKTLFEIDEVWDYAKKMYDIAISAPSDSGWPTRLENFISHYINNFKFNNIDDIKNVYENYALKVKDGLADLDLMDAFDNLLNDYSNKNFFETKINKLKKHLSDFKIEIPVVNFDDDFDNHMNNLKGLFVLSQIVNGFFNSNDIIANLEVSATLKGQISASTKKTSDYKIWNSKTKAFGKPWIEEQLMPNVDPKFPIQTLKFDTFRAINDLSTVFMNQDTLLSHTGRFSKLNNLTGDKGGVEINYKADYYPYGEFGMANWTKNAEAIGVSTNKYLSELIYLNNTKIAGGGKDGNDVDVFVNDMLPDSKKMLVEMLEGKYIFHDNEINSDICYEMPLYLLKDKTSNAKKFDKDVEERKNSDGIKHTHFLNEVIGGVGINDVNYVLENLKLSETGTNEDNLLFWKNAWDKMGIELANGKYPLFVPNDTNGIFYIVGKVNGFYGNVDYDKLRKKIIDDDGIILDGRGVLINKYDIKGEGKNDEYANPDGYFILKLKSCFYQNFNYDVDKKRKYKTNGDEILTDLRDIFFKKILSNKNNGIGKYWINDAESFSNESFFEKNKWDRNNIKLDYKKIWRDIFAVEGEVGLLGGNSETERVKNYFTRLVQEDLRIYIEEKFGVDAEILKEYDKNIEFNTKLRDIVNLLDSGDKFKVDGRLFFFDSVVIDENGKKQLVTSKMWRSLGLYNEYYELLNNRVPNPAFNPDLPVSKDNLEFLVNPDLESNPFYRFFINNTSSYENGDVDYMFQMLNTIKEIFVENKNHEMIIWLTEKLKSLNFLLPVGDSAKKYKTGVQELKSGVREFNSKNDPLIIFKQEAGQLFMEKYGKKYLDEVINRFRIVGGNKIGSGLVFSSMSQLVNNNIVNTILKQKEIVKDDVFNEVPVLIDGVVVDGTFDYEVSELLGENGFWIQKINIGGNVFYKFVNSSTGDVNLDLSLEELVEFVEANKIINEKPEYYFVDKDGLPLNASMKQPLNDIKKIYKTVNDRNALTVNMKHTLKTGNIVLVSSVPITILIVIILACVFIKVRKNKRQF